jgi:asparagine synthase (glutamine-hydrolysing)
MCGIAGIINWGDAEVLAHMTDIQGHRGPDDRGVWERQFPQGTRVGLGSRRLAILDLSAAGHMPMGNEAGTVRITYNGEVYNFQELRQELIIAGYRFRSNTDTEVILRLYEKEGPDCVKRLNGMFVLAICDGRDANHPVVCCRKTGSGAGVIFNRRWFRR